MKADFEEWLANGDPANASDSLWEYRKRWQMAVSAVLSLLKSL